MKTLDEVIEACEDSVATLCFDCTLGYCNTGNDCFIQDALHYLKEYRNKMRNLESARDNLKAEYALLEDAQYEAWVQSEEEKFPLTWDELKAMEGKPIWFEVLDAEALPALDKNGWGIVACTTYTTWEGISCFSLVRPGVTYALPISGYGKTWQAYRKERQ